MAFIKIDKSDHLLILIKDLLILINKEHLLILIND